MEIPAFSPATWLLLMLAGFAGGLIDSIAGGGGLITVPALLASGLPPQLALGTNKMQSACGTLLAVIRYGRAGLLETPGILPAAIFAGIAGAAGAWSVSIASPEMLRLVIPWMLAAVTLYTAMNHRFGLAVRPRLLPAMGFSVVAGLILGFYDGFFGPGTGSFWMVALVALMGLDLRHATGYTKAVNLASNLGALACFLSLDQVHFAAAAAMIAGQIPGARVGSSLVIRQGLTLIRPVFLTVVGILTLKLMHDAWTGDSKPTKDVHAEERN